MCLPGALEFQDSVGSYPTVFNFNGEIKWHSSRCANLLDHAAANGYGIPAFNVNNLEQVQAVMEAAKEVGAPVILQASAVPASMRVKPSSST
jgi:thiamine pyrophosphate-dependent acetolactate synthase large subunit-like protein